MGKDYFESDEFKETLKRYEEELAEEGTVYMDSGDFMDVADYYLSVGRYDEAEACVDMALEEHPDEEELLIIKGSCCICQKKYDEAEKLHERLDQTSLDIIYQRAQVRYARWHDYEGASSLWREWMRLTLKEEPNEEVERDCYMHVVASILELRDTAIMEIVDEDKLYLMQWLDEYKRKYQPLGRSDYDEMIADTFIATIMPDIIVDWYNEILERRPYMNKGWCRLAVANLLLDKFDQCIEAADFALAVKPDDLDAMAAKANALLALQAWDEALQQYKELREKGGGKIHNVNMAVAYLKIGDPTKAFLCLKELKSELDGYLEQLRNSPDHILHSKSSMLDGLGAAEYIGIYVQICLEVADKLRENGRFVESDDYLKSALEYDNENYHTYICLAENSFMEKNWQDGVDYFKLALDCCDKQHKITVGVRFSIYLLACGCTSLCKDILDKCSQEENLTEKDMALVNVAYSYYYMNECDRRSFRKYYEKVIDSGGLVDDAFYSLLKKGWSKKKIVDYIEEHFDAMRDVLMGHFANIIGNGDTSSVQKWDDTDL